MSKRSPKRNGRPQQGAKTTQAPKASPGNPTGDMAAIELLDSPAYAIFKSELFKRPSHAICADPFRLHSSQGLQEPATAIRQFMPPNKAPEQIMVPGNCIPLCAECDKRAGEVLGG